MIFPVIIINGVAYGMSTSLKENQLSISFEKNKGWIKYGEVDEYE